MVSIKNVGKRQVTIMLGHETESLRFSQTQRDKLTGVVRQKRVPLQVATSVTLDPGEILSGLPDSMLASADVMAGVAAKRLGVHHTPDVAADAAPEKKSTKPARNKGK
jgi:hypothetical protein